MCNSFFFLERLLSFKFFWLLGEEDGSVFVDVEHSYCLPLSNSQESIDEKFAVSNYLDHDYASSPMSPPPKPPSPKKTPLKDRNRIVDRHKIDKNYIVEKK